MFVIYKTDASDKFDMGYYVTKVRSKWVHFVALTSISTWICKSSASVPDWTDAGRTALKSNGLLLA
jgi:hypothetical protein